MEDLISGVLILIHLADAFVLVMACVDCARVQLKTLSSLLNTNLCWCPGTGAQPASVNTA